MFRRDFEIYDYDKEQEKISSFEYESDKATGAVVEFRGLVRNHHNNQNVLGLYYEVFKDMALNESEKICNETRHQFDIINITGFHSYGYLNIGDIAIYLVVESAHRKEAFEACMYAVDEIKARLPIWKKESYASGETLWREQ